MFARMMRRSKKNVGELYLLQRKDHFLQKVCNFDSPCDAFSELHQFVVGFFDLETLKQISACKTGSYINWPTLVPKCRKFS